MEARSPFAEVRKKASMRLATSRRLTGNQWAEEHGYLSAESNAIPGKWRSIGFQGYILDASTDPNIEEIWILKSTRLGFTRILLHTIGYYIEHDPSSILLLQPDLPTAREFSQQEITEYLRDVRVLRRMFPEDMEKGGRNSIYQKKFPDGILQIAAASTPRTFRRTSRRIILMDETSLYPLNVGKEGSPIDLAKRRSDSFKNRKIIGGSTPKLKETCQATKRYEETDRGVWEMPCPHCGHFQHFEFRNLKWPDGDTSKAYFQCTGVSNCKIEHRYKLSMMNKGRAKARAVARKKGIIGLHVWAAYSMQPNTTWTDIVDQYLTAKASGDSAKLQEFYNAWLAEAFDEELFVAAAANELKERAEFYKRGTAPDGVIYCTAGIDVQDNRLAVKIVGWGMGEECWIINYEEIYGNPAESVTSPTSVWASLDKLLEAPIPHEKYQDLKVVAGAIDTGGHYTHEVYQYVRSRSHKNLIAIRGSPQRNKPIIMKPTLQDINYRGKIMKKGVRLYSLGTDTIKTLIHGRLKIVPDPQKNPDVNAPLPRRIHFSADLTEDYFRGLQSEKKVLKMKRGQEIFVWEKISSSIRNEPLDCFVYAIAVREFFAKRYPHGMVAEMIRALLKLKNGDADPENLKTDEQRREYQDKKKAKAKKRKPDPGPSGGSWMNF